MLTDPTREVVNFYSMPLAFVSHQVLSDVMRVHYLLYTYTRYGQWDKNVGFLTVIR